MTDSLWAIIFGAVQGLTEFLPVSSSGHLVVLHSIADFSAGNALAFDVALHIGTAAALLWVFWAEVVRLLRAWLGSFKRGSQPLTADAKLAWLLLLGTVPAALAGFLFESLIVETFRSSSVVGLMLIVGGIALWAADRWGRQHGTIQRLSPAQSVWIGIGQALALIPGVSRAGATITAGRLLGLDRTSAARFSFLLAIPIVLAAGAKQILDLWQDPGDVTISVFLLGALAAALVGVVAIRLLLRFVSNHSYGVFAVYRIILGIAILIWLR